MSRRNKSAESTARQEANRMQKQSELQITEQEKPLSPPSKCISSQKRLEFKRRKLLEFESHEER